MILTLLKKIKSSLLSILEDIYLLIFSINKKEFITNEFKELIKNYESKKLNHWEQIAYLVLKKISKFGFYNFLRFRLIKDTMFANNDNNFDKYLSLIDIDKDQRFIKEVSFGNPVLSKNAKFTSINKLHQFYHLKLFNELSHRKHSDIFIELGGGYGLLCLLCIKFFKVKKYIIFDLEGFLYLQKIYLLKILTKEEFSRIHFVSDINILIRIISKIKRFDFFAFWSFSEIDIHFRKKFISIIKKSKFFLIGYQDYFHEINNYKYFEKFVKELKEFSIFKNKHPCHKDNYYLFGKR